MKFSDDVTELVAPKGGRELIREYASTLVALECNDEVLDDDFFALLKQCTQLKEKFVAHRCLGAHRAAELPDFARASFVEGWATYLYLEGLLEISTVVPPDDLPVDSIPKGLRALMEKATRIIFKMPTLAPFAHTNLLKDKEITWDPPRQTLITNVDAYVICKLIRRNPQVFLNGGKLRYRYVVLYRDTQGALLSYEQRDQIQKALAKTRKLCQFATPYLPGLKFDFPADTPIKQIIYNGPFMKGTAFGSLPVTTAKE